MPRNTLPPPAANRAPSLDDIADIASATRDALPEPFRRLAQGVALVVDDSAPDAVLDEMGIDHPLDLTGLYQGIPMTEKSLLDSPAEPDTIFLFRAAILDEWCARGNVTLGELVAHVYLHELAHHFGWSDDDIARVAPWQD